MKENRTITITITKAQAERILFAIDAAFGEFAGLGDTLTEDEIAVKTMIRAALREAGN